MLTQEEPNIEHLVTLLNVKVKRFRTISTMEADNSEAKEGASEVGSPPHLKPWVSTVVRNLLLGRPLDGVELGLQLSGVNLRVAESSKGVCSLLSPALHHQPARALGEEDQYRGLKNRDNEENPKRDLICPSVRQGGCPLVNGGTHDGAARQHDLVKTEGNTSEVSWRSFIDIELGEGNEPANSNSWHWRVRILARE